MPAAIVVSPALVLRLLPSGERYQRASLLSPERGVLHAMRRLSAKSDAFRIDLFEEIEAKLEFKPDGQASFLKDAQLLRRRAGLGASYAALEAASSISKLVLLNPPHEDQASDLYALASRALDALDRGASPPAALAKTLYSYCRDEGYPIREEWGRQLSPSESSLAKAVLNAPLAEIDAPEAEQRALLSSIQRYIASATHLRLE